MKEPTLKEVFLKEWQDMPKIEAEDFPLEGTHGTIVKAIALLEDSFDYSGSTTTSHIADEKVRSAISLLYTALEEIK